jgi:hypothetical protein
MAAALLANGKGLPRIIVPNALLHQTAQILHSKLGLLLNREVMHVPFSRQTPSNQRTLDVFHNLHDALKAGAGVMICVPEHMLSFKLGGFQKLLDFERTEERRRLRQRRIEVAARGHGIRHRQVQDQPVGGQRENDQGERAQEQETRLKEAKRMIEIQDYLDSYCRDILDESDHTLAVRTQLIYPSGSELMVDGAPMRWEVAQALFRLVLRHLDTLSRKNDRSVKVHHAHGTSGFPCSSSPTLRPRCSS